MPWRQRYSAAAVSPRNSVAARSALTGDVQHRAPVPPYQSVRPRREPPPDLAVEPVPLPGFHHEVARKGGKQPDVRLRRVRDLPVEPPDYRVGEHPGSGDFRLIRR